MPALILAMLLVGCSGRACTEVRALQDQDAIAGTRCQATCRCEPAK